MSDRIVHVCHGNLTGEQHPETLPPHRIMLDCESKFGVPKCMGCAAMGPAHCTCTTLTKEELEQCAVDAWDAYLARDGKPCDDCAFRAGSPESDRIEEIAAQGVPFRCHKGMPVDARGGVPIKDAYCPPTHLKNGANDYPICVGWRNAHAAFLKRQEQEASGG